MRWSEISQLLLCILIRSGFYFFFPAWHESQSFISALAKRKVVTRRSSVLLFLALIFVLKYRSKRTNYKVAVFERFRFRFFFHSGVN